MASSDFDVESLSSSQKESLQLFSSMTGQEVADAVPLLRRSQWNVQVLLFNPPNLDTC
jgi:FAS-associated factor 2